MREIRKERGLTQDQAADLLNTDQGNISRWENGKHLPTEDMLDMIGEKYDVNADSFVGKAVERANLVLAITSRLSSLNEDELSLVVDLLDLIELSPSSDLSLKKVSIS